MMIYNQTFNSSFHQKSGRCNITIARRGTSKEKLDLPLGLEYHQQTEVGIKNFAIFSTFSKIISKLSV